ncbi:MAG: sarcosine oxidase subunit gamma [Granulosicoccus sp.]
MSKSALVAVMDQFPDKTTSKSTMCSALVHVGLPNVGNSVQMEQSSAQTVYVQERPVTGFLLLRASEQSNALSEALQDRCGLALSSRLQSDTNDEYCVRWMSPDSWLLTCPLDQAYAIEIDLRKAVDAHIGIVNVSGGYSILELSGNRARDVLMKSTGYDTHPDNFAEGKVVNTTFAKAQVTLRSVELNQGWGRYELIVRRSFCDYVWMWIQQASEEFGLDASTGTY